jgi:hypothetical protein
MSVTFTASTLGPTASSFTLTSSSGVTGSGASSPLTLQEAVVGTYTYSVSGVNANGTGPSSAASNSVVVASLFAPSGAYEPIASVVVPSGGVSSITFGSIPQTYTHLQIRAMVLTSAQANMEVRFNEDTGANYALHQLQGNGSAASSEAQSSEVRSRICLLNPNASYPAVSVTDILDYTNTNKTTTIRTLWGADAAAADTQARVGITSGLWNNTAAVTSILLFATSFSQHSSFSLYGIKGN